MTTFVFVNIQIIKKFSLGCLTWMVFVLLYGNQSLESKFIRNDVADYLSTRPSVISEQPLEQNIRVRTLETSEQQLSQTKPINHIEKEGSEVGVRTSKVVSTNKTNSTEQIEQKEERSQNPKLKHKVDWTKTANSTEQTKQKEERSQNPILNWTKKTKSTEQTKQKEERSQNPILNWTKKTNSTEQTKQKEERSQNPILNWTNKTNSKAQTKQKEGRSRNPKLKHKVDWTNKTNLTEHECPPRPPTAQRRHNNVWVQIDEYTVTKALTELSNDREYLHEKMISQMLSPYPNFVTLLSWDDKCRTLVYERLFPAKGWPKRMQPRLDDWGIVETQIEEIWKVFEELSILPSVEFLKGLNNIMIGTTGNVTMFDFHTYHLKSSPHKRENPPFEYNQTKNNEYKDRLLSDLREKRESNRF